MVYVRERGFGWLFDVFGTDHTTVPAQLETPFMELQLSKRKENKNLVGPFD